MAQLIGGGINLVDDPASARLKFYDLAAAIVFRVHALDPAGIFKVMQEVDQSRFLDPEPGGKFRLGDGTGAARKMQQSAPARLA